MFNTFIQNNLFTCIYFCAKIEKVEYVDNKGMEGFRMVRYFLRTKESTAERQRISEGKHSSDNLKYNSFSRYALQSEQESKDKRTIHIGNEFLYKFSLDL